MVRVWFFEHFAELVLLHAEFGLRPGLSGQTLVSTGLADFDKLLGGGLPLTTVTLLLEDSYTQHHSTLLKYFLAEGAANHQALHWSAGYKAHASEARTLPQQVKHVPKVAIETKLIRYCRLKVVSCASTTGRCQRQAAGE